MLEKTDYDVVIIGTGPAGLQAAIHAARKKVSVLVIENFCCLFNVSGEAMLDVGRQQATNFGSVLLDEDVLSISRDGEFFKIITESNIELQSKTIIIATGTARKKLGVVGEKEFLGRGVSYCVECDANFYKDEDVVVAGGASAAVSGALSMLNYAKTVHLVGDKLEVTEALKEGLEKSDVILHVNSKIEEIAGKGSVETVKLSDGTTISVNGVFIELGAKGVMELATHLGIQLDDEMKYIRTNKKMETNIAGVYAAGDICGPPWQMAKAVGEGCVAGIGAAAYAKKMGKSG
jgi:thioredoxin reductase (NADPH)